MKIKELILKLQEFNQELEVLASGDPEGNDYRTIDFISQDFSIDGENRDYVIIYPTDTLIDLDNKE